MAKEGNKSSGAKHVVGGPCTDCKTAEGTFTAVRRYSVSGKGTIVRLCEKCAPRV